MREGGSERNMREEVKERGGRREYCQVYCYYQAI